MDTEGFNLLVVRVNEEVDPELELTYILSEEERIGKKRTMLFNNVKGSKMRRISITIKACAHRAEFR